MNELELKSVDEKAGTFEAVMSAPVLDRQDEIVDAWAFDPLPAHIMIDIDHGLTVEKTVGSGTPFYDRAGILKVKGTFASTPLGQTTRTLVKEGHIRHLSIAFRDAVKERDKSDGKIHVRKGELLNCTITGIPANTATMFTSVKFGDGSRKATDLEWARAKARAQILMASAWLALNPAEPEPIGDHRKFIEKFGARAYVAAIKEGRR